MTAFSRDVFRNAFLWCTFYQNGAVFSGGIAVAGGHSAPMFVVIELP